jgi:hypothetical protein
MVPGGPSLGTQEDMRIALYAPHYLSYKDYKAAKSHGQPLCRNLEDLIFAIEISLLVSLLGLVQREPKSFLIFFIGKLPEP